MAIRINGEVFQIEEILLSINVIRLIGRGAARVDIDCDEFYQKFSEGEYVEEAEAEVQALSWESEAEKKEAEFREGLVKTYRDHLEKLSKKEEIESAIRKFCFLRGHKPVRLRTVREYHRKYAGGNFLALVPNFRARGGNGWSSKKHLIEFAKEAALTTYFVDDKINKSGFYRIVDELIRQEFNVTFPGKTLSESTCSRVIASCPVNSALNGRLEARELNLEERRAVKKYRDCRAFAVVELDAATVDIFVIDEHGRKHTEVTLYLMRDVRTSYPLAVYVMAGRPSEMGLYKLLEQFYSPRNDQYYQSLGVSGIDIVPAARISTLVIDNASEHFGRLVWEVISRLGIAVKNTRQYRGDDKGYVESGFAILLKRLFSFMPGAKKSQDKRVKNRMDKAEAEACYTVDEVYKHVVEFLYGTYINEKNTDLGFLYKKPTSIAQAMDIELSSFKPLPPPPIEKFRKLIALMHCVERKFHSYGIDFENFKYNSSELSRCMDESGTKDVVVYYNPADCTKIYVAKVGDKQNRLIEVPNKTIGIPEISFEEAAYLRSQYTGDRIMTGKDYQRLHGQKLIKFHQDSKRSSKVSERNKAARKQSKAKFHSEIDAELSRNAIKPKQITTQESEHDDDIIPSSWSNGHE
ncbi:Mu transposase C-terminal domain-containing protein [Metapseudomonas furukawaii]|uniref:Mu transposase C-terminal domain-containing protein n=1 Tax=Metapseudomonas furukawaii TaxID=1149133 RepID=UPI00227D3111|nr:Mu transposase C-terminal domain-containing protein [Pseudomonas furukawaii]WAG79132.1 Mu transposase C-terminal domain-containing protein [Pseudomonas furukawaii]